MDQERSNHIEAIAKEKEREKEREKEVLNLQKPELQRFKFYPERKDQVYCLPHML